MSLPKILPSARRPRGAAPPAATAHAAEPGVNSPARRPPTASPRRSRPAPRPSASSRCGPTSSPTPATSTRPTTSTCQHRQPSTPRSSSSTPPAPSRCSSCSSTRRGPTASADGYVPPTDPRTTATSCRRFAAHNKARRQRRRLRGLERARREPASGTRARTPASYTALLKAAYAGDQGRRPGAPPSSPARRPATTTSGSRASTAAGAGGSFDAVAVHTDTACLDRGPDEFYRENGKLARYTFLGYRTVHDMMAAHGDGGKPIWMSELGWSSTGGGPTSCTRGQWAGQKPSGVSEADQAAYLTKAYACLANDPYVHQGRLVHAARHDRQRRSTSSTTTACCAPTARQSPRWPRSARSRPRTAAAPRPCGDFDAPAIRVVKPTPSQQFVDKLDLSAAASDGGVGIARITFAYDTDVEIRNFTDGLANNAPVGLAPWQGSGKLGLGPHTIDRHRAGQERQHVDAEGPGRQGRRRGAEVDADADGQAEVQEGQVQEARLQGLGLDLARGGRQGRRRGPVAGRQGRRRVAVPQQEGQVAQAGRRPQAGQQALHLQGQAEAQGQVARARRLPGPGAVEEGVVEVPHVQGEVADPPR